MPDDRLHQLHKTASDALAEAAELYKAEPLPGSPEWRRLHELLTRAMDANEAYIKAQSNLPPVPTGPDKPAPGAGPGRS